MKTKQKLTQKEAVLKHLKKGKSITPIEALNYFGSFRLSSIINRLRKDGIDIVTIPVEFTSKYGFKSRYAKYKIVKN